MLLGDICLMRPTLREARAALAGLTGPLRRRAFDRYRKLRPHLEEAIPLTRVAAEAGLPLRTAQRWVSRYRRFGLAGLSRAARADQGKRRRVPDELRRLAEGLACKTPHSAQARSIARCAASL